MAAISDYLEGKILDHVLRGTAYSSPTTVYLALYIDSPQDSDVGTEVSGGGYVRQPVTFNRSDNQVLNSGDVTFPIASADWGTVSHIGVRDTGGTSGGNLLFWGLASLPKKIDAGDQLILKSGDLSISID